MTEPSRMLSVLSSTKRCLGFVLFSAKGYRAFDSDAKPLGMFADADQAARSVYQAAAGDN